VDSNVYISALVPGEVPQGGFDIVGTDDIASLAWRLERLGDSLWSLAAGRRQPQASSAPTHWRGRLSSIHSAESASLI